MTYIVLTEQNKDFLLNFLEEYFSGYMAQKNISCVPVKLKNGQYVIPSDMLSDKKWLPVYQAIKNAGYANFLTIRMVNKNEFPESEV